MIDIPLEKFKSAQAFLKLKSPLTPFDSKIFLKAESLQPSGSFKIRGATYCLSQLIEKTKGVVTYSTGNHAQAVAMAAKNFGIQAIIVMSQDAPTHKVQATEKLGATVVMADSTSKARQKMAEELAKSKNYFLLPPYDHPDVITGQGTIGIEILEANPSVVFVPVGGGGLIAGIAMAIKKTSPAVKIIGVEPELENDAVRSFMSGKHESLEGPSTSIADAIKVQTLGEMTYPLIMHYVDDMVQVSEQQIKDATLMHAEKAHLVVEPSGALALAAALNYKGKTPIVCIASGGNIPLATLCSLHHS